MAEVDGSPAGFGQGNVGFSGTPMWKIKQQQQNNPKPAVPLPPTKKELEAAKKLEDLLVANVRMHSASLGGPAKSAEEKVATKPFVRHVLVKDLRKVAKATKVTLPTSGLFADGLPLAFFALFDGQSSGAESPGPQAAEWCCRNMHTKLLKNLSALTPQQTNDTFLKATLVKTFSELDEDLLATQPDIQDGCGAALALLVADTLFTAVVGKCDAVFMDIPLAAGSASKPSPSQRLQPRSMGSKQGRCTLPEEVRYLQTMGGQVMQNPDGNACLRDSMGRVSGVSRSLGDRAWKATGRALLRSDPQVDSVKLSYEAGFPCIMLTAAPVTENVTFEKLADIVSEVRGRPRAICGEVASAAAAALGSDDSADANANLRQQCSVVTLVFLPPRTIPKDLAALAAGASGGPVAPPAAKKLKTEEPTTVRLRNILLRHRDCTHPHNPVTRTDVTRTEQEADTILRKALRDILQEQAEDQAKTKPAVDPKKAALAHLTPRPKCMALIKELSECQSVNQGGNMRGDLKWMNTDQLKQFGGPAFAEAAQDLSIGQWSDLVSSPNGLHLLQRIA